MMWYYMYPSVEEVKDLPMYIFSIGLHELQPCIDRPEGFEYDQFFYNSNGSGWLEMNGKTYELPEGSAFFIPAKTPHKYYPEGEIWDVRWMTPAGFALPEIYRKYHLEEGGVFPLIDESGLDRILNRMRKDLILNEKYGNVLAAGHVYAFIMEFIYQTVLRNQDDVKEDSGDKNISLLKEYISNHYMHPISLEDLCTVAPMTPQHMCRIFKKHMGMRPLEYITQIRLEKAKELLLYSDYSIKEVGEKCGFQNGNYFCKTFKKNEHITPLEYRNSIL